MRFYALTLICIVIASLIILPPSLGKTKPFLDDYENILPGSIAEKDFVDINGASLGMFVMAKDESRPVILFLGGGPGIPEYFLEQKYPSGLEDEFVVCYLEYRGTSMSYSSNTSADTMTSEQYISDVVGVTNYLRERFGKDKIYLMAHSFGTYIGIQAAAQHPELYHAYISLAQIVDQLESEKTAYAYMIDRYRAVGNEKMVKKFEDYPIFTSDDAYERYAISSLRDAAMHDLGVGTTRDMRSVMSGIFFPSLRCTVYTPMERINIWRGKMFAKNTAVVTDSMHFNAFEQVPSLKVPIYFFAGAYDYTCLYSLQKEYYAQIQAPLKGFYTFENSAHSPLFEEPDKAMGILTQDIVNGTNIRLNVGNEYESPVACPENPCRLH